VALSHLINDLHMARHRISSEVLLAWVHQGCVCSPTCSSEVYLWPMVRPMLKYSVVM
jgi:hypothetical protein